VAFIAPHEALAGAGNEGLAAAEEAHRGRVGDPAARSSKGRTAGDDWMDLIIR
jgi:hypothetical protein